MVTVASHVPCSTLALAIHRVARLRTARIALAAFRTVLAPSTIGAAFCAARSTPSLTAEALTGDVMTIGVVQTVTCGAATRSPGAIVTFDVTPRALPSGPTRALPGHRVAFGPVLASARLHAVRPEEAVWTGLLATDAHPACEKEN